MSACFKNCKLKRYLFLGATFSAFLSMHKSTFCFFFNMCAIMNKVLSIMQHCFTYGLVTQELWKLKAFIKIFGQTLRKQQIDDAILYYNTYLSLQACSYTHEQIVEMMEFLIEYGPAQLYWEPAEVFLKLSCVQLLLQLISIACNWKTYYARWDQKFRMKFSIYIIHV